VLFNGIKQLAEPDATHEFGDQYVFAGQFRIHLGRTDKSHTFFHPATEQFCISAFLAEVQLIQEHLSEVVQKIVGKAGANNGKEFQSSEHESQGCAISHEYLADAGPPDLDGHVVTVLQVGGEHAGH
jgi:hypothetical protein